MRPTSINKELILPVVLVFLAAFSRTVPHPFNFTAIGALALFSGASFSDKRLAFIIPFGAMLVSDLILGYQPAMAVYLCFAFSVGLGLFMRPAGSVSRIIIASLTGSVVFYLVTNLPVFYPGMYSMDLNGLMASYTAATPFFRNQLIGDLFFSGMLFGSFSLLRRLSWNPGV